MSPQRRGIGLALTELVLGGERKLGDPGQLRSPIRALEARQVQLLTVEARTFEQRGNLSSVELGVACRETRHFEMTSGNLTLTSPFVTRAARRCCLHV